MLRAVKAHPGVFIGGMVTYAIVTHVLVPKYGKGVSAKMGK
jgi:hypothetical protein